MEFTFFMFISWIVFKIAEHVFILSVLFILTPEFCLKNNLRTYTRNPMHDVFKWTGIFMAISVMVVNPMLLCVVVGLTMFAAGAVSWWIHVRWMIKNLKR